MTHPIPYIGVVCNESQQCFDVWANFCLGGCIYTCIHSLVDFELQQPVDV
jgi:hypothetical protein